MIIRTANLQDAASIAKVHVDSWRTTYKGIISANFLNQLSYEKRTALWETNLTQTDVTVYVAQNADDEIIGFVVGSKRETNTEHGATDLTAIYLLEQWQGKGVGKLLLKQMMQKFNEQGFQKVYVDVLADNRSREFYKHYGAQYVKTISISFDGEPINEEIYVWPSVDAVLAILEN